MFTDKTAKKSFSVVKRTRKHQKTDVTMCLIYLDNKSVEITCQ